MADSTNTPAEVWRAIPNFTDYSVSSTGRVMRTAGGKGAKPMRIIKQSKDQGGRLVFNASMSGKVKQLKVHRAVAFAFIGPCPEGHEVAHLDGNQENNCVVNLSYSTPVENNGHKRAHGTQPMGSDIHCAKLRESDVASIRRQYPKKSYAVLAKEHGVSVNSIVQVVKRISWKHI